MNLTDIKENYVISNTELKSEEDATVPDEGDNTPADDANNNNQNVNDIAENGIENLQTYDSFESYLVLCLVNLMILVGSVINIKKSFKLKIKTVLLWCVFLFKGVLVVHVLYV